MDWHFADHVGKSHPAWVCGLKLFEIGDYVMYRGSHPAWVCGLKPGMENNKQSNTVVTPCVGVWIETVVSLLPMKLIEVTPCVGVWIETSVNETSPSIILSHPAWVCGLKPWNLLNQNTQLPSHPAWVCGLKQL